MFKLRNIDGHHSLKHLGNFHCHQNHHQYDHYQEILTSSGLGIGCLAELEYTLLTICLLLAVLLVGVLVTLMMIMAKVVIW